MVSALEVTSSSTSQTGHRGLLLLLTAWTLPLVLSATLFAARTLAESWAPAPVPAFCDGWPFSIDEEAPLPPECEPAVPPRWVDVLERVTRFTEELVTLAGAVGLVLAVAVVVMTRRERAVDPKARLAFRLAVATLVLVVGGLLITGVVLLVAVASFPIRG